MNTILAGLRNWKTTLAGAAIALANIYLSGGFSGLSSQEALLTAGFAIFGFLTKDATMTGAPKAEVVE